MRTGDNAKSRTLRQLLIGAYVSAMASHRFAPLNRFLVDCGARGLGVNNAVDLAGEVETCSSYLRGRLAPVIFDVGANVGSFSVGMKKACPDARLHAFEPHPGAFDELSRVAECSGFQCHRLAVGKTIEREVHLHVRTDMDASSHSSLSRDVVEAAARGNVRSFPVEMSTVAVLAERFSIDSIDLLKIDVEGCEYDVILGAQPLIAAGKVGAILFEFADSVSHVGRYMHEYLRVLSGFDIYRVGSRGLVPIEPDANPLFLNLIGYQVIFAVRRKG